MPSTSAPLTNKLCPCGKKVCAREFCNACYYRELRHGNVKPGSQTKRWKHRLTNIDEMAKMADCAACGKVKITRRSKTTWRCSTDVNNRSRDYKRAYRQGKKNQLLEKCEICGTSEKLCWDHNHTTGNFRGTLCGPCNKGIGHFFDSPELCVRAAEYLRNKSE